MRILDDYTIPVPRAGQEPLYQGVLVLEDLSQHLTFVFNCHDEQIVKNVMAHLHAALFFICERNVSIGADEGGVILAHQFDQPMNYYRVPVSKEHSSLGSTFYLAQVTEIPSVIAHGASVEEALDKVQDAFRLGLLHLLKQHLPIPLPGETPHQSADQEGEAS